MSRQPDQEHEDRVSRRNRAATRAIKGGLRNALSRSGFTLTGFTYKDRGYDHLMVLKVLKEEQPVIAFIGADSLAGLLVKAVRLAERGKLTFRADKYGT